MAITLEQLINKAREKEANKVKITVLNIEGFGEIEFQRPSEAKIMEYAADCVKSTKGLKVNKTSKNNGDSENLENNAENAEIETIDLYKFSKAASKFIYHCCSMLRDKSIREIYPKTEFEDIPLALFGDKVINIATKLNQIFKGKETVKEIKDAVKN